LLVGHLIEDSDDDFYDEPCRDCTRRMRVGDVAMVFDRGKGVFTDRDLVWHKHCIQAAVDAAPLERDQLAAAVERIRERGLRPIQEALA
jgi:hypothetical protein